MSKIEAIYQTIIWIQKGNLTHNGVWTVEGAISRKPDGPQRKRCFGCDEQGAESVQKGC